MGRGVEQLAGKACVAQQVVDATGLHAAVVTEVPLAVSPHKGKVMARRVADDSTERITLRIDNERYWKGKAIFLLPCQVERQVRPERRAEGCAAAQTLAGLAGVARAAGQWLVSHEGYGGIRQIAGCTGRQFQTIVRNVPRAHVVAQRARQLLGQWKFERRSQAWQHACPQQEQFVTILAARNGETGKAVLAGGAAEGTYKVMRPLAGHGACVGLCNVVRLLTKWPVRGVQRLEQRVAEAGGTQIWESLHLQSRSVKAMDPVSEPSYNMEQIIKQSILLEEHLVEDKKYCPDCVTKHFMHILGLAEEAKMLAGKRRLPYVGVAVARYGDIFAAWRAKKRSKTVRLECAEALRAMRKKLVKAYIVKR